jgi:hypothetical protein
MRTRGLRALMRIVRFATPRIRGVCFPGIACPIDQLLAGVAHGVALRIGQQTMARTVEIEINTIELECVA